MRQACHQAIADGIATGDENHRHGSGRLLRGFDRPIAVGEHHVRPLAQYLRNSRPDPIGVTGAPMKIDLEIAADLPAGLLDLAPEHGGAKLALRILLRIQHEQADAANPAGLLRARRERPGTRAAKSSNEFPPSNLSCHLPL